MYLARSSDGGVTWDSPLLMADENGNWERAAKIEVDRNGRAHLIWSEIGAIKYTTSATGETGTWSSPIRILDGNLLES